MRPSIYRGALLAVLLQWSLRLVGLVSVVLLARILAPADFGMVGLAAAALALVELISAFGLRQALLRIQEPEREHLDTAFTIQLLLCSAMALAGLAAAPLIAHLYEEPALTAVIAALSCRYFLLGLVNIGIVDFDRNLEFGRDLRMRLLSRLAAVAVTVAAALWLRSYWALVLGLICQSGFHAAATWLAHPYRPRLSLARRSELLGTSIWIFIQALAQTVQQQIERLALGRFAGAHLLGLYSVSKDLSDIFTQEIATALNRVTFVAVARSGGPLSEAPERVPRLLGAYAMIAAPLGLGLAAVSQDAIAVLLGPQWVGAAPILEIVAAYSALFAVYRVIASALTASGRARNAAFLSSGAAFLLIVAVGTASLVHPHVMTIAWTSLAANAAVLLAGIAMIARESSCRLVPLLSSVLRPFAAAGLMFAIVRVTAVDAGLPFAELIVGLAVGVVAYPLLLMLAWILAGRAAGAESEAWRLAAALRARLALRPR